MIANNSPTQAADVCVKSRFSQDIAHVIAADGRTLNLGTPLLRVFSRRLMLSTVVVICGGLTVTVSGAEALLAGSGSRAVAVQSALDERLPAKRIIGEGLALAQAAASGEDVEVASLRETYSSTYAQPDGSLRMDLSTIPRQIEKSDGSWAAPDESLVRSPDGRWAPRASAATVSFSGGGSGPMVIVGDGDRTLSLSFGSPLPTPEVSGATATYPEVLSGVDLRLTATMEGYRQVMVVKSAEAARQPALAKLTWPMTRSGLSVSTPPGGGLQAFDANGTVVLTSPPGFMWDSAGEPAPAISGGTVAMTASDEPVPVELDQISPGDAAAVAAMPTTATQTSLTVVPDATMLRDTGSVFPIFIDPTIGIDRSSHTMIRSDGFKDWKFTDDEGLGMCSSAVIGGVTYYCGTGYVKRLIYQFPGSSLAGKRVIDATFRTYETSSFQCSPAWVNLYRLSGTISASTAWPGPDKVDKMGDRYVSAGRGSLCSPEQPNAWIEFNDNPDEADENLTSTVADLAEGRWSSLALELRASDESDTKEWKRFRHDAVLSVIYAVEPGVPTNVGVKASSGAGMGCGSSNAPSTVTTLTPTLGATVQAEVQPAAGDDKGELTANFRLTTSASTTTLWSSPATTTGWKEDGIAVTTSMPAGRLANGGTYRVQARTQSHYGPSDFFSSYGAYCYFKVITTAPPAPSVTSLTTGQATYTECTGGTCDASGGPSHSGNFKASVTGGATKVTWTLSREGEVVKDSTTGNPMTGTATTSAGSATFTITPSLPGTYALGVTASNAAGPSPDTTFTFSVAAGAGPTGAWTVSNQSDPGANSVGGGQPLAMTAVAASNLGRRAGEIPLDGALSFAGSGHAASASPTLDTSKAFSVSAWAYLTSTAANGTVVSQRAVSSTGPGYSIYYSTHYKAWIFNWLHIDTTGAQKITRSIGKQTSPPTNVWTHVAGVYNDQAKTIELFVNGARQGAVSVTGAATPTATDGPMSVGRLNLSGGTEHFIGLIDEVTVWQRALTPDEARQSSRTTDPTTGKSAIALVGNWALQGSTSSLVDQSPYARGALATFGTPTVDPASGMVLNGTTQGASTTAPLIDESGSFTVSVSVSALGIKTGKGIAAAQLNAAGTGTAWALYYNFNADQSQWTFERRGLNGASAVVATAATPKGPIDRNANILLTGVFDAVAGTVQLYSSWRPQCPARTPECGAWFTQGTGAKELRVGAGGQSSTKADYLPGTVGQVRVWAGALDATTIATL